MRNTFISLCLLVPAVTSAAVSSPPCGNLEPIDQIKAFVTCQGSLALAACGGLGGLAVGRAASAGLQRRYLKVMDAAQDTLAHDIAEGARDEMRAPRRLSDPKARLAEVEGEVARGKEYVDLRARHQRATAKEAPFHVPENELKAEDFDRLLAEKKPLTDELAKVERESRQNPIRAGDRFREKRALEAALKRNPRGPIFEPLLARIPGDDMLTYDVANLPYDELPEQLRHGYDVRAKATADLIRARVASGQPLDDAFIETATRDVHAQWAKEHRRIPRPPDAGLIDADDVAKAELERTKAMVKRGAARLRELETSTLARGLGPAMKIARRLGSAGPLAAAGIVAAPLFAAGQIAGADSPACADAGAPYVNRDPAQNCRPVYEVDEKVAEFLAKPSGEQKDLLSRYPNVCTYYRDLHAHLFAQPKFTGLSCQSVGPDRSRVIIKAQTESGQPREYRVDVRGDRSVSAVGVYSEHGMKVSLYNFANANEELTTKLSGNSNAGRELKQIKLFVPEAVLCCAARTAECANNFGAPREWYDPEMTSSTK